MKRSQALRLAAALSLLPALFLVAAGAATPASGSIGPKDGARFAWSYAPVVGAAPYQVAHRCVAPACDSFTLNLKLPQKDPIFYRTHSATLKIHYVWDAPAAYTDLDVWAISPTGGENGPGKPDTDIPYEDLLISNPASGTWTIYSVAFASPTPVSARAVATLSFRPLPAGPARLALRSVDPAFRNHDFPVSYQTRDAMQEPNAGEPSIGVDWATGSIMYMARSQITRIDLKNGRPTYTDVTPPQLSVPNFDQILVVDSQLHRTFAEGWLVGGSNFAYSDDDGRSWMPSTGSSLFVNNDHPTVGSGPYHHPAPAATYPHAVYLCAQNPNFSVNASSSAGDSACALSTDGGRTFGVGHYIWQGRCTPENGHVRVGPTGTVFLPNPQCTDTKGRARTGLAVSDDNGTTWSVRVVPDSSSAPVQFADPSVAQGPDGTIYLGYLDASGHPKIAVSHTEGKSWSRSVDVGRFADPAGTEDGVANGIQNSAFPEVITGSPGRAAFAFVGTGTPGASQDSSFKGVWYLFVSYTFDGGRTWKTVNATPDDPVQRGCVWLNGLSGSPYCRNMLEFNDITIDSHGRVLVAYTDGCTGRCMREDRTDTTGCPANGFPYGAPFESTPTCTYGRLSAIAAQTCGRTLLASDDRTFSQCIRR